MSPTDTPKPTSPVPAISQKRLTLVGGLMVAVGPLSITIYTPAVPQLVTEFATTEAALNASISLFFAGFALAQLICGTLSDGLGRKAVALSFFALYVLASFLALVAPTIELLWAARLMQGIGAAAGVSISRALVRDLFSGRKSTRVLNAMAVIITAGPTLAPTLGSFLLLVGGYQLIFGALLLNGLIVMALIWVFIPETVTRDPERIRIGRLVKAFGRLVTDPSFMLPTGAVAGATGTVYGMATLLPFILISRVGLTPFQFGIGMFLQTGMYLLGSLAARFWMARERDRYVVPFGLALMGTGATILSADLLLFPPSYLSVMGPVAIISFGAAHTNPHFVTEAFRAFPEIAGAASSLNGFAQLALGFVIGMLAIVIGDPVVAMATIVPACFFGATVCGMLSYMGNMPASGSAE